MKRRNTRIKEFQVIPGCKVITARFGNVSKESLATGDINNNVYLWNISKDKPISTLSQNQSSSHQSEATAVLFNNDDTELFSGTNRGVINVWDISQERLSYKLKGHTVGVNTLTAFPNNDAGNLLISGSFDTHIKVWDLRTKNQIHMFKGHTMVVNCLAGSPDGKLIASGSSDGLIKLWDLTMGKCVSTLNTHDASVTCIKFNPEEMAFASGSADRTVKYFDLGTYMMVSSTKADATGIQQIMFNQDGTHAYSAATDSLKLWNLENDAALVDNIESQMRGALLDLAIQDEDDMLLGVNYHAQSLSLWACPLLTPGHQHSQQKQSEFESRLNGFKQQQNQPIAPPTMSVARTRSIPSQQPQQPQQQQQSQLPFQSVKNSSKGFLPSLDNSNKSKVAGEFQSPQQYQQRPSTQQQFYQQQQAQQQQQYPQQSYSIEQKYRKMQSMDAYNYDVKDNPVAAITNEGNKNIFSDQYKQQKSCQEFYNPIGQNHLRINADKLENTSSSNLPSILPSLSQKLHGIEDNSNNISPRQQPQLFNIRKLHPVEDAIPSVKRHKIEPILNKQPYFTDDQFIQSEQQQPERQQEFNQNPQQQQQQQKHQYQQPQQNKNFSPIANMGQDRPPSSKREHAKQREQQKPEFQHVQADPIDVKESLMLSMKDYTDINEIGMTDEKQKKILEQIDFIDDISKVHSKFMLIMSKRVETVAPLQKYWEKDDIQRSLIEIQKLTDPFNLMDAMKMTVSLSKMSKLDNNGICIVLQKCKLLIASQYSQHIKVGVEVIELVLQELKASQVLDENKEMDVQIIEELKQFSTTSRLKKIAEKKGKSELGILVLQLLEDLNEFISSHQPEWNE